MPRQQPVRLAAALLACALTGAPYASGAEPDADTTLRQTVDDAVKPILAQYRIPGMAVAVTRDGARHFFVYGVAAKTPQLPVTRDTLFELGSVSKTFTATLAAYAEATGKLSLNDTVAHHLPEFEGAAVGGVRLRDLATHTAGGFPLQLPESVTTPDKLRAYYRAWTPQSAPRTQRVYANPSVGLLGIATAKALGSSFAAAEERLFRALGLTRTFVHVPKSEMTSYAWGYDRGDRPVRVSPALLADEAYGVRSNIVDMLRFLEVNMQVASLPAPLAAAVKATHTGYFHAGELTQDLVWEQYPFPVDLAKLIAGNGSAMISPVAATEITPPLPPRDDVWINKTGATNSFASYVAFIPAKKIGIVILANKNYPNAARVTAAYRVLTSLAR